MCQRIKIPAPTSEMQDIVITCMKEEIDAVTHELKVILRSLVT